MLLEAPGIATSSKKLLVTRAWFSLGENHTGNTACPKLHRPDGSPSPRVLKGLQPQAITIGYWGNREVGRGHDFGFKLV